MAGESVLKSGSFVKVFIVCISLISSALSQAAIPPVTDAPAINHKNIQKTQANEKKAFYLRFSPGKKASMMAAVRGLGARVNYQLDRYDTLVISLPEQAVKALASLKNVVLLEPVPEYKLQAQVVPWNIDQFQARDVWDTDRDGVIDPGAPDGSGVKFCIIDTGFWAAHDDFQGITHSGMSQIPGEAYTEDEHGHGTHVAGTANAVNNSIGVVGVMPGGAELVIVKIFANDGNWSPGNSNLGVAVEYCRDQGANVISMSLGGGFSATEDTIFQDVYDNNNILSVAAAGNDGNTVASYPASYESVISVAAIRQSDNVADFSQYPGTAHDPLNQPANTEWDVVELSGGGESVLSTWPGPPAGPNGNVPIIQVTNDGTDYSALQIVETSSGDVTQILVDGNLCDAGDINGNWAGSVVLCSRGTISFADKMNNVATNGGLAVVLYNNEAGSLSATCGGNCTSGATIPGLSITQVEGQFLQANGLGLPTRVLIDDGSGCVGCSGGYNTISGTSMATPGVAAGVAWAWDACGGPAGITNKQLRQLLRDSARDLSGTHDASGDAYGTGWDVHTGFGLVQLKDALDLGNQRFGSTCPIGFSVQPQSVDVCTIPTAVDAVYDITLNENFTGTTNMTFSGIPAGSSAVYSPATVVFPATASTFTVSDLDNLAFASTTITLTATDAADPLNTQSSDIMLNTFSAVPAGMTLTAPVDTASGVGMMPTFSWTAAAEANSYTLEIATDPAFSNIVQSLPGLETTTATANSPLNPNSTYYWRVTAENTCGNQASIVFSFTTLNQVCAIYTSTDVPKTIVASPAPGAITSTLNVPDSGVILDINVVNLSGEHTWISDLVFKLESPDTTEITLMNQTCLNEDNWDVGFDDEAASATLPCPPTDGLSYQPAMPLSTFDGEEMNGNWTFTVDDSFNLDGGALNSWGLEICSIAPAPVTYTVGGTASGLAATGLVLQNNGGDDLPVDADGSFTFVTALSNGSSYLVTVLSEPLIPDQSCTVNNGSGTLAGANVSNVTVSCVTTCRVTTASGVVNITGVAMEACENVLTDPSLYVTQNGELTLAAGLGITLGGGFTVEKGGLMNAKVCGQSLCETSLEPMPDGCHSCVTQICASNPECCLSEFSQACVDKVGSVCGLTCD